MTLPDPDFMPSPGTSISAVSATDIWLVGSTLDAATDTFVPETLNYNGTTWAVVPVAPPGEASSSLDAPSAISQATCGRSASRSERIAQSAAAP